MPFRFDSQHSQMAEILKMHPNHNINVAEYTSFHGHPALNIWATEQRGNDLYNTVANYIIWKKHLYSFFLYGKGMGSDVDDLFNGVKTLQLK